MSTLLAPRFKLPLHETHNTRNANISKHAHSQFRFFFFFYFSVDLFLLFIRFPCVLRNPHRNRKKKQKQKLNVNTLKRLNCTRKYTTQNLISWNTIFHFLFHFWLIYLVVKLIKVTPYFSIVAEQSILHRKHICPIRIVHDFNWSLQWSKIKTANIQNDYYYSNNKCNELYNSKTK